MEIVHFWKLQMVFSGVGTFWKTRRKLSEGLMGEERKILKREMRKRQEEDMTVELKRAKQSREEAEPYCF